MIDRITEKNRGIGGRIAHAAVRFGGLAVLAATASGIGARPELAHADDLMPRTFLDSIGREYTVAPFSKDELIIFTSQNGLEVWDDENVMKLSPNTGLFYGGKVKLGVYAKEARSLVIRTHGCGGVLSKDIIANTSEGKVLGLLDEEMKRIPRVEQRDYSEIGIGIGLDDTKQPASPALMDGSIDLGDRGPVTGCSTEPAKAEPTVQPTVVAPVATAAPTPIPTAAPIQNLLRCGISVPLSALLSEIKSVGYNGPEDAGSVQAAGNRTVNCTPASSLIVAAASVGGGYCPDYVIAGMGAPIEYRGANGVVIARIYGIPPKVGPGGLDIADHPPFVTTISPALKNTATEPGAISASIDQVAGVTMFTLDNMTAPNLSRNAQGDVEWNLKVGKFRLFRWDAEEACIRVKSRERNIVLDFSQYASGPGGQAHITSLLRLPFFDASMITAFRPPVPGSQGQLVGPEGSAFFSENAIKQGMPDRQNRSNYPNYILAGLDTNGMSFGIGQSSGSGQQFVELGKNY